MKLKLHFSGLLCMVRYWPKGASWEAASEKYKHQVTILGLDSAPHLGAEHDTEPSRHGSVPHHGSLLLPLAAIERSSTEIDPDRVLDTNDGQVGLWMLDGHDVSFESDRPNEAGVDFRDRLRPRNRKSPSQNSPGDWEDVAWLAELERVLDTPVHRDPHAATRFRVHLHEGKIRGVKPRAEQDAEAVFRFEPEPNPAYSQSFSDRVLYELKSGSIFIRITKNNVTKTIALSDDAQATISCLPASLPDDDGSGKVHHFAAFYSLLSLRTGPIPKRLPSGAEEGSSTIDPLFCLMAVINEELR